VSGAATGAKTRAKAGAKAGAKVDAKPGAGKAPTKRAAPTPHAPSRRDGSPAAQRRARTLVAAIVEHHLGSGPRRIAANGGGLTNHVFSVDHAAGPLIVRMNEAPDKIDDFLKEQWAIARAHDAGVPVPEVLEVGMQAVPHPYMISRRVRGENARVHRHRRTVLQQMGHFGALINAIPTAGFGQTFDWSHNRLSHNDSWDDFLAREFDIESRLDLLRRQRMIPAAQAKALRAILASLPPKLLRSRLNHGDMRPKNVLADERGNVTAIIDWEDCCANPPFWDLSIALHDLSIDEKRAYVESYGLDGAALAEVAPAIRALNLLNYAAAIELALQAGDQQELAHIRLRLSGVFDLYAMG
jgi:aminoglycoside phosphotransferase (APT) family kinase protein